jgi:serine/threonine protein kinase
LYRLCGFPPFYHDNNAKLFDMIGRGEFEFPSPYWDEISDQAKDLIKQLLIVNPSERLNAD